MRKEILRQYANSPKLLALVDLLENTCGTGDDLNEFYNRVYNLSTAIGFGLDTWGQILQVPRTYRLTNREGEDLGEQTLDDDLYRILLFLKCAKNITNATLPAIEKALNIIFSKKTGIFVTDIGSVIEDKPMTMRYTFLSLLSDLEYALLTQSNVLPKPLGVNIEIYELPEYNVFGFNGSGLHGFNQGTFFQGRRGIISGYKEVDDSVTNDVEFLKTTSGSGQLHLGGYFDLYIKNPDNENIDHYIVRLPSDNYTYNIDTSGSSVNTTFVDSEGNNPLTDKTKAYLVGTGSINGVTDDGALRISKTKVCNYGFAFKSSSTGYIDDGSYELLKAGTYDIKYIGNWDEGGSYGDGMQRTFTTQLTLSNNTMIKIEHTADNVLYIRNILSDSTYLKFTNGDGSVNLTSNFKNFVMLNSTDKKDILIDFTRRKE